MIPTAGILTRAVFSHLTGFSPMKNVELIKRAGIAASLAFQVAGVSCFAVLMHDTTGPRNLTSQALSNLCLASLFLPGLAIAPLAVASRAANRIEAQNLA